MKYVAALFILSAHAADKNRPELISMLNNYNADFNVNSEYYTEYGCNCLGDLERSGVGGGVTLDMLDRGCKHWHNCLRCAQESYDESCTSDKAAYRMTLDNGDVQCKNGVDTCKRAICECDKRFAMTMGESMKFI